MSKTNVAVPYMGCPQVAIVGGDGGGGEMKIFSIDTEVEIQIGMGFVFMNCRFLNTTGALCDGVFTVPTVSGAATVVACDITFGGKTFSSSMVDPEAQKQNLDDKMSKVLEDSSGSSDYNPSVFTMPFHGCPSKSEVVVQVKYMQSLQFNSSNGEYSLKIPMTVPAKGLFMSREIHEAITFKILITPGTQEGGWHSKSHKLNVDSNDYKTITLSGNNALNRDLEVGFTAWNQDLSGTCLMQKEPNVSGRPLDGGSFVTFLQPPAEHLADPIGRSIVFMLDHSYSMSAGSVMDTAKKAMQAALRQIKPIDTFTVVAFDSKQKWWNGQGDPYHRSGVPQLFPGSAEYVKMALAWVQRIEPERLTDIITPYTDATNLLYGENNSVASGGSGGSFGGGMTQNPANATNEGLGNRLPIVILITDGAVGQQQDHQIIDFAARSRAGRARPVRTFTYGIGPYCNSYLLSQLADAGNGYSETCVNMDGMEDSMTRFLSKTKAPVMIDVQISGLGKGVTMFPSSIPDVTVGCPLIVCGKYDDKDSIPARFTVSGFGPNNKRISFEVDVRHSANAPLHQLVEKSRLDVLVGKWYMSRDESEKEQLKKMCIQGSLQNHVPCIFTQAVAYENSNAAPVPKNPDLPSGYYGPNNTTAVYVYDANENQNRKKRGVMGTVGAVVLLGTCVTGFYAFGNPGATMANSGVFNAMSSLGSGGYEMFAHAGEAGWATVSGIDWGAVGGGMGDAMNVTGNALGSAVNVVGSADYGGMLNAVGGGLGQAGNAIGGLAGQVGNAVQSCNCFCFKIDENMLNCGFCPCSPLDTINQCGGCNLCNTVQNCNVCASCPAINVGDVFSGIFSCNFASICGACDLGCIGNAVGGAAGDIATGAGSAAGDVAEVAGGCCTSIPVDSIVEGLSSAADCVFSILGGLLDGLN